MRLPVSTAWPCLHAAVNLTVADTRAVVTSLPLACARRPTDRAAPACRLLPAFFLPAPPISGACASWQHRAPESRQYRAPPITLG